jgi:hypothetical protein
LVLKDYKDLLVSLVLKVRLDQLGQLDLRVILEQPDQQVLPEHKVLKELPDHRAFKVQQA